MTLVILLIFALAIWLVARAVSTKNRIEELSHRLDTLESEIARLRQEKESPKPVESDSPLPAHREVVTPTPVTLPGPIETPQPAFSPPRPPTTASTPVSKPPPRPTPKINWEQFVGVKGFAWVGGLALFLGVVFFVKYSFDNNLVPPVLRVTIGFLVGLGLLVGGVVMSRKRFPVLSQTLCATGVVILYSVTFACRSIYHFDFFGPIPTFLLMALITTTAFLVAVRLNALVVAILGMLGGFLTPVLLSTGQDNPLGLFGYIAILDVGLIVVAFNRRWYFLTALAAFGTAIMQLSWAGEFFVSEKYFEGNKILIALAVLLGFNALYLAANWWAKDRQLPDSEESLILGLGRVRARSWLSGSALGLVGVTFMLTAWFLDFDPLAQRPWLMFSFVFLVDLGVAALVLADETIAINQSIAGLAVFALLGFWTEGSLTDETLNAALAFYFLFALVHSALPTLLERRRGVTTQTWANHIFPVLALALVLVPVFTLAEVSIIVWPFILLVDLLAIALAVWTEMLLPVLAVLLFTLAATGELIFKIPSDLSGLPVSFFSARRVRRFLRRSRHLVGEDIPARCTQEWDQIRQRPCRAGRFGCNSAGERHRASVPAPHHGDAAAAAYKSVADLRPRAFADRVVAWCYKTVFARLDARRRPRLRERTRMRVAFQPLRSRKYKAAVGSGLNLVFDLLRSVRTVSVSVLETIFHQSYSVGDCSNGRAAAIFSNPPLRIRRLPEPSDGIVARCICDTGIVEPGRGVEKTPRRKQSAHGSTRVVWRRGTLFHHTDFPDPVRPAMDHHRVGAGRHGFVVAVSSCAASWSAADRRRPAHRRVLAARVQPRRVRLPYARRDPDFQLVSVRLRHRDDLYVRRHKTSRAAAQPDFGRKCSADSCRMRHGAGLPADEHRDRRLLQRTGFDAHL